MEVLMLYISRAALQLVKSDEKENDTRISVLLTEVCTRNGITYKNIKSIIFSQTDDIDFINPARSARNIGKLSHVALFCTREPQYPNHISNAVRLLIFFSHFNPFKKVRSVYLYGTDHLRPDLQ